MSCSCDRAVVIITITFDDGEKRRRRQDTGRNHPQKHTCLCITITYTVVLSPLRNIYISLCIDMAIYTYINAGASEALGLYSPLVQSGLHPSLPGFVQKLSRVHTHTNVKRTQSALPPRARTSFVRSRRIQAEREECFPLNKLVYQTLAI